ncbi:MAG: hypothetical protein Crog4KO_27540 [Crocinitomicaceae bacterium]
MRGVFLIIPVVFFYLQSIAQEETRELRVNGISIRSDLERRDIADFEFIEASNASWVSFQPNGIVENDSAGVHFDIDTLWECTSFKGLANNIRISKNLGYSVFVKPHLVLAYKKAGSWVGDLKLGKDANWERFKETYAKYIIRLARLSDSLDVEMLSLGTEIEEIPKIDSIYWQTLIDTVRKEFNGKITFCANFDAYKDYPFWEQMDYIGIDAYFSIDNSKNADLGQCREGWKPIAEEIQRFAKGLNKQVLFTEFGYMSVDHCAHRPFEQQSGNVNLVAQANAYRAVFDTFWHQSWFAGGFSWRWYFNHTEVESYDNPFYSPQHKPAANIIAKYYSKYRYF